MPTHEENVQKVIDMRARILDPDKDNPTEEELYEAIEALHKTRGAAASKKKVETKTIDLNDLFK